MKWEKGKIGEHCEVTSSKRIFYSEYVETGVPFYRSKEIIESSQGQPISEPLFISQEKYDGIKEKFGVPGPGDMLLTSVGTIGVPYIVKKDDHFYFKDGNLTWFRNFDGALLPEFLYYWIRSAEGYGVLYNTTIGSSQKALTIAALKNVELPLPPLQVQQKVVQYMSVYDKLVANCQQQIKLLEEAAQRLYKEWFVDLRFPGYENVAVVDGVPEGWIRATVEGVSCVLRRGISPKYNNDASSVVINQKCIRTSIVDFSEARIQDKAFIAEMNLQDSDTVICSTGAGTLGRVGQVYGVYPDTTFDSHITLVRASSVVGKQYLYYYIKSRQAYLMGMGKGSTNQLELSRETIKNLSLLIPRPTLANKFERIVQPMHDRITSLVATAKRATEARDRLLPKLMSGELEVFG